MPETTRMHTSLKDGRRMLDHRVYSGPDYEGQAEVESKDRQEVFTPLLSDLLQSGETENKHASVPRNSN